MRLSSFLIMSSILLSSGCQSFINPATNADNVPNLFDRRPGKIALKDEQIEIKARSDLEADLQIPFQSRINLNAHNGLLLVTGEAADEETHHRIIEKVRIIQNVKRVQDEIVIAGSTDPGTQAADSIIASRIKLALDGVHNPENFNSNNIKIVTESGTVYLLGLVFKSEADIATQITQTVAGVNKVVKLFEYLN